MFIDSITPKLIGAWLLAATVFGILAFFLFDGKKTLAIVTDGWKVLDGEVVSYDAQEHGLMSVRYRVGTTLYTTTQAGYHARLGDDLKVYVSNVNASLVTLDEPQHAFKTVLQISGFAAFSFATLLVSGLYWSKRGTNSRRETADLAFRPRLVLAGCASAFVFGFFVTYLSGNTPRYFGVTTGIALAGFVLLFISSWSLPRNAPWGRVLSGKAALVGLAFLLLAGLSRIFF